MTSNRGFQRAGTGVILAVLGIASCIPAGEGTGGGRPQGESDLAVTASTDSPQVVEGVAVTLTATAAGGTLPYLFRWDQNDGPVDLDLEAIDVTSATLTTEPLDEIGRYVFRVIVTDAEGLTDTDFVAVEVTEGIAVEVDTETLEVFEGMTATFAATTERGVPPFAFRWELASGPVDLDLSEATSATLTTEPFAAAGEYTFAVTVTDAGGFEATAEVMIEVRPAVTAAEPELAIAGEPVELTVTVETETEGLTFLWEVVSGAAAFDDDTAQNPMLTTTADETVELLLTVTIPTEAGPAVQTTRELQVVSVAEEHPRVLLETNLGEFTVELDREATPRHTANFLFYIDTGFYTDMLFHRVACEVDSDSGDCVPAILQGGGYQRVDGELELQDPPREPVASEAAEGQTSLARYEVSLALAGNDPDSGTSQFFISLREDNEFFGVENFTVFGRVVEGTEVIDAIAGVETEENPVIPTGEVSLPVEDVIILRTIRILP